jgi:hypothetical protein
MDDGRDWRSSVQSFYDSLWGIGFLSAVADRFGLWGVYGHSNVAWGNFDRCVRYTAKLNWFLPSAMIPAVAIIATAAEDSLRASPCYEGGVREKYPAWQDGRPRRDC